ncbi:2010_t:CDS:10 [Cetraspora pellucida]|uniref:2010_t:CDS:1 n=1 Tax=Cetraspora pellucida TaxID=1433469 RepID=A0A9N8Z0Q4_9GLOM|nr:2010_t:CDS:10 [Cetraspora pellucida]
MLPPCSRCGKDDFKKTQDRDAYLNHKFLYKSSNIQNLIVASILLQQNLATDQILTQTYVSIDRYNASTNEKWSELGEFLLYDYPKRNIITVKGNFSGKPQAVIPSPENIKYKFNHYVEDRNKYLEAPYMPQLIANAREQITRVLKAKLCKKDQIKTALIAQCIYSRHVSKGKDKLKSSLTIIAYHRSLMCVILTEKDINEHINLSISKIDNAIDTFMQKGSGMNLIRIEMLTIEAYIYQRAFGGLYISTPKKLANTKYTINPDNSEIINPVTNMLSDNCLQGALACYFANKDGYTEHLERIYTKKDYKQYLDIIEEMNPDISINVWEWKEEAATPKSVIYSKNYNRPHIIHLMAFTDITKSEDDKYRQKNHFLWIKNYDGLVFKNTKHHSEDCQRVDLSTKGVNNFEKFKNYEQIINALCIIIADFKTDNKKYDKKYEGQMHKIAEQKANSFCYLEFVKRIDKELVQINRVLAIKHDQIETNKDKKKFNEADSCWICKEKFIIDEDKVVAETFKQYKSMKIGQLKYIDSMQFMNSSLASLTKNLGDNHPITSEHFKKLGYTKDQLDLVYRKGVYPYDYMDLQDSEYHDIYLKTDVLSLADVWTQLRKMSMEYDGLDPSHYVLLPAYSWDAMLKMTDVKIELFTDMSMHDFIEKAKCRAVENMPVNKNMLCPYTTELVDNLDSECFSVTEKLVPHLGPQEDYDNWLAPYIAFNTEKHNEVKKAGNTFLSNFFKLKNNAIYSKTMENIRKPLFKYARQLDPSLIRAHMGKASITLNKPIIVGASVLGLSKLHMYHFWYGYVKEKYGDKAQLGYMDTDSFIFQDETPDSVITESYHIRAKSYHYILANKSTKSKHKGVSKKDMSEMAMNSYMPALEGFLLDDSVDRSLLTEQEANDLAMRTKADSITLAFLKHEVDRYQRNKKSQYNPTIEAETKSRNSASLVLYTNIASLYSKEEVNARIKEATDNLCQEFIKSTKETLKTIKQQKDIECNQIKIDMANWKEKDGKSYSNISWKT